ncbi:MAG: hypothetical protein ACUVTE_05695 [Candidatus Bathycorpusculaceae bacterium]
MQPKLVDIGCVNVGVPILWWRLITIKGGMSPNIVKKSMVFAKLSFAKSVLSKVSAAMLMLATAEN